MKTNQIVLILTLFFITLMTSCNKFEDNESDNEDFIENIETNSRSGTGEYCGLIPSFCDINISVGGFAHVPDYTTSPFQGGGGGGVNLRLSNKDVEVFHYWLTDGSLAFYIIDGAERYVIHQSDNGTARYFSDPQGETNELTTLFDLQLKGVETKDGLSQKISKLDSVTSVIEGGKSTYELKANSNTGTGIHYLVRNCRIKRMSAVENFIHQFTDDTGLMSPQLPGLIAIAFNECGDGYADECNNCVDPRCVVDQLIADESGGIGGIQKELIVAKYLELALGWDEEEFNFFTTGQDSRDYMLDLYQYASFENSCDAVFILKDIFDESECNELMDISSLSEYNSCVDEEIFIRARLYQEENTNEIDLCERLDCFVLDDPTSTNMTFSIYVDQPIVNQDDAWDMTVSGPNVGHVFIRISQIINGEEISLQFGLYPDNFTVPGLGNLNGIIKNDGENSVGDSIDKEYDVGVDFSLDLNQFIALVQNLLNFACNADPITYNLDSFNCTDFALQTAATIGIILPDNFGMWPNGGGSNPGSLGQDIRELPLSTDYSLTVGGGVGGGTINCDEE